MANEFSQNFYNYVPMQVRQEVIACQPLPSKWRSDRITLRCVPGKHTAERKGEKGISH